MINSVCGVGSTGRICTDIAKILKAQGHECKIAYGRKAAPEEFAEFGVQIGNFRGVKIHGVLSRIFDDAGFHSKRATKNFIRWVEEYNPDVIHLHNLHGYYLHIGVLFNYLKKAKKPIIWTLHDCWSFTGHCSHYDFVGCEKYIGGCHHCPQKKRYPASLFFDNSKKNYERKKKLFTGLDNLTIVTPSKWLGEQVKKSFLKDYPVQVIYNGVDLSIFKPTQSDFRVKYGLEDKKIILGVANVWDDRKGFDEFIKLSSLVDDTYHIVLVGVSDEQMKVLPKNILGIRRTNSVQELAGIYTAADVLFNPTYEDNYPTVNLEAQACGTPVITYATGGSVESVPIDNVIQKGNLEAFVETIGQARGLTEISAIDKDEKLAEYLMLFV